VAEITIIVPTLNEEGNVDLLLQRIFATFASKDLSIEVLFVDSASADDTRARVSAWCGHKPVRLLGRDVNTGLAGAVLAGAGNTEALYVVVMDADLSHPPESIPLLLTPVLAGDYDMVLGSRYVQGGSMPDWPATRKLSSRLATLPALLFCDVCDPLAGFFALRRELLLSLPGPVPGFKIGLAVLAEYHRQLRVLEVPIEFRDRDYGESKMNNRVVWQYLQQLAGLALRRLRSRLEGTGRHSS
jgi:dolichol-phosphate mannosyltransferase